MKSFVQLEPVFGLGFVLEDQRRAAAGTKSTSRDAFPSGHAPALCLDGFRAFVLELKMALHKVRPTLRTPRPPPSPIPQPFQLARCLRTFPLRLRVVQSLARSLVRQMARPKMMVRAYEAVPPGLGATEALKLGLKDGDAGCLACGRAPVARGAGQRGTCLHTH